MMTTITDDSVLTELVKLVNLATVVMNEHKNDGGLCVVCGSAWPCERVLFADHNLELI
jgi:hypothetical protein